MKKSFSEIFSPEEIKKILKPDRNVTAIIGDLQILAGKAVGKIEKRIYASVDEFLSALSNGESEINAWFQNVDVDGNIVEVEKCVTSGLRRALLDPRTQKLPSFYEEIEKKYLILKGEYTVVLNPLCIICHVAVESLARAIVIVGKKLRIFPLAYRSGLTGKRVYAEKVISLAQQKSGVRREKVESMLDKYECLYYLDFIG